MFTLFCSLASAAALIIPSAKLVTMRMAVAKAKLARSCSGTLHWLSGRKNSTTGYRFAVLLLGPTAGLAGIGEIVDAEPASGSEGVAEVEGGSRGRRMNASPDVRMDPRRTIWTSRQAVGRSFGNCELSGAHALAFATGRALFGSPTSEHRVRHIANGQNSLRIAMPKPFSKVGAMRMSSSNLSVVSRAHASAMAALAITSAT